jgi:hypothetical protein
MPGRQQLPQTHAAGQTPAEHRKVLHCALELIEQPGKCVLASDA